MRYILDTHVWIWWHSRPEKLSERVRELIADSRGYEELLLSAISPWEFSRLVERGRLSVAGEPEVWLSEALKMPGLRLVPLSPRIALRSTTLPPPFHNDPADQILVATAREERAVLLTADRLLLDYPHVETLWQGNRSQVDSSAVGCLSTNRDCQGADRPTSPGAARTGGPLLDSHGS